VTTVLEKEERCRVTVWVVELTRRCFNERGRDYLRTHWIGWYES
jgi:hypothetical protein